MGPHNAHQIIYLTCINDNPPTPAHLRLHRGFYLSLPGSRLHLCRFGTHLYKPPSTSRMNFISSRTLGYARNPATSKQTLKQLLQNPGTGWFRNVGATAIHYKYEFERWGEGCAKSSEKVKSKKKGLKKMYEYPIANKDLFLVARAAIVLALWSVKIEMCVASPSPSHPSLPRFPPNNYELPRWNMPTGEHFPQ